MVHSVRADGPGEVTFVPTPALNVTIDYGGRHYGFTAQGDGAAVVAAFRVWLETVPALHDGDALDVAAEQLAAAPALGQESLPDGRRRPVISRPYVDEGGLHGVAPLRGKRFRDQGDGIRANILAMFRDRAVLEQVDVLAKLEGTRPSKIAEALGIMVRKGILVESRAGGVFQYRVATK